MSEATIDDLASTFADSAPGALAAEPGQNLLQVRGLRKNYGARRVVHDVSLDVRNGEVVGLLGPTAPARRLRST